MILLSKHFRLKCFESAVIFYICAVMIQIAWLSNQRVANKKEIVLSLLETKLVQIGIIQKFDSISGEKANCLNSFKDLNKRSANIVKCLNSEDIRCNH